MIHNESHDMIEPNDFAVASFFIGTVIVILEERFMPIPKNVLVLVSTSFVSNHVHFQPEMALVAIGIFTFERLHSLSKVEYVLFRHNHTNNSPKSTLLNIRVN